MVKMPTKILYEVAGVFSWRNTEYRRHREHVPSFFETYNSLAVKGSSEHRQSPTADKSVSDLLSVPSIWAQDVVAGIYSKRLPGLELLIEVGQFLFDASFYGFSLEKLSQEHHEEISRNDYLGIEQVLQEDPKTADIPQSMPQNILSNFKMNSYIITIPMGYGTKSKFVHRTNVDSLTQDVYAVWRKMLIQTDLGKRISYMLQEVPPKREQDDLLSSLDVALEEYRKMMQNNGSNAALVAEFHEIARMATELPQNKNNRHTRIIMNKIKAFEKMVRYELSSATFTESIKKDL